MKIAIIQRFLPSRSRGGVGHFTHGLANTLVKHDHAVTLFTQDPKPQDALYDVHRVPTPKHAKWAPITFPFQLSKIDFSRFDIVHAQGDDQWLSKTSRPPLVRTLHGSSWIEAMHNGLKRRSLKHFLLHSYFYLFELLADYRADYVVAVSGHTRRFYARVDEVIGNGIDLDLFHGSAAKSEIPSILFVGELHSRKRGKLLADLFLEQIQPVLPNAELWMVCPEKIEAPGIRWFTKLESKELATLYKQAWVFCLPSSYEGFGRPYVEALACGTAVVATLNPGALEILAQGEYGSIVTDKNLGPQILALLNNSELRQNFALKGFKRAAHYSWESVAAKYEQIYQKLLDGKKIK